MVGRPALPDAGPAEAAAVVVPAAEDEATLAIKGTGRDKPRRIPFTVRATVLDGNERVVGETQVDLVWLGRAEPVASF